MDTELSTAEQRVDCYDISGIDLTDPRWCYLRDYHKENYSCENGSLKLRGTKITLEEADTPSFAGMRQSEFTTKLSVTVGGNAAEAGFSFYMDEDQHYDLALTRREENPTVVLKLKVGDAQTVKKVFPLPADSREAVLEADSTPEEYRFYVRQGENREFLGSARTKYLSSEVAGGFTGVVMGLYAIDEEGRWAEFKNLTWEQR
jgi:alpha-N-arabinofuranosidase